MLNNQGKEMKIKWKLGNRDIYIKRQVQLNLMLSTSYSYSFLETLGSRSKFKNIRNGTIVQYLLKKKRTRSPLEAGSGEGIPTMSGPWKDSFRGIFQAYVPGSRGSCDQSCWVPQFLLWTLDGGQATIRAQQ